MRRWLTIVLAALSALPTAASAVLPHRSFDSLTTGNGLLHAVYDGAQGKLVTFNEHPYASPAPGVQTRNLAYDAYFGVRAAGQAAWLPTRPIDSLEYVNQSHVARAVQSLGPLRAETHVFAPFGLSAPAVVLLLHATNASRSTVADAAAYALLNFHLGTGAPNPAADAERIDWDANTNSYAETGPSGLTLHYLPLGGAVVHSASPAPLLATGAEGGEFTTVDSSGVLNDASAGFQWTFGAMAAGEERYVGVLITLGSAADGRAFLAGRDGAALLQSELAALEAWRTPPPAGLSAAELRVYRQSEVVLRLAQSREAAPSAGQIVAALPPGQWSISWVRDQAYAMQALARMGHAAEASAAVDFWLAGRVGGYKRFVGADYSVSVVRYYGDGEEWSDSNGDGPNIEFDGFGLAALAGRAAGRSELDQAAAPLLTLIDSTNLISADSSIWEHHWNGKQRHFAYTSIAAAAGLCAAGRSAEALALRDALAQKLVLPTGGLAGDLEELQSQAPARDAATVEAINFGLIDPKGPLSLATLAELSKLRTAAGVGFMRNDDGGGYDSEEWVFIDLRSSDAYRRAGRLADADQLLAWVTQQADANHGLHAELYDANAADYTGAIPMVGFGAGAYVLALWDRAAPRPRPTCFQAAATTAGGSSCATASSGLFAALGLLALLGRRRGRPGGTSRPRCALPLALACALSLAGCHSGSAAAPDAGAPDSGVATLLGPPARDCSTALEWKLQKSAAHVGVAGEWNQFSISADPMFDLLGTGTYRVSLRLPPGDYGYKFVADAQYSFDPNNPLSKYVGGTENSRLIVLDCTQPILRPLRAEVLSDQTLALDVQVVDGAGRAGIDPGAIAVQIDGAPAAAALVAYDAPSATLAVRASGLPTGKHTLRVDAKDSKGRAATQLIVPLWIESAPFDWSDGVFYLAFIDRFRNGDPTNDAPIGGINPKLDYQGGDLQGVSAALKDGWFDKLGVKAIWLSPVYQGPAGAWPGSFGPGSGYHGYWPAQPHAVETRFGGAAALQAVIAEAHTHGIRIVLDLVQRHVHQSHPYYRDHAQDGWFHGETCVCGTTSACTFDNKPYDCLFAPYLPAIDYTDEAAADQLADDAVQWLTDFDADGFRIDAVKQMPHVALSTLRARVKQLEAGNARYLMMGETFTSDRATIASSLSPGQLTGQFDFPLYYAIDSALGHGQGSMADLDAAVQAGVQAYGANQMSPFLGNHDVPRFLSRANGDDLSDPINKPPAAPTTGASYDTLLVAEAFTLTQPGIPLLYYGDEIGMAGAGDPDNRRFMRFDSLSPNESALLARMRLLGQARATHPGLRRGARKTLLALGDIYIYARGAGPDLALVVLNRGASVTPQHVALPADLGNQDGPLRDLLGGAGATVSGGGLDLTLAPRSAAILSR